MIAGGGIVGEEGQRSPWRCGGVGWEWSKRRLGPEEASVSSSTEQAVSRKDSLRLYWVEISKSIDINNSTGERGTF